MSAAGNEVLTRETMKYQVKFKVRLKISAFPESFEVSRAENDRKKVFVPARDMIYDVSKNFKKSKISESKISPW